MLNSAMNVDLGIWDKLTKLVWGLLLAAGLLVLALWYLPLIRQNERMRKETMRLDAEIIKVESSVRQTRDSIEAMHDPKVLERLAREKLGYAKPGETVIRFESPTNGSGR
jgi:cell division protein FtsB